MFYLFYYIFCVIEDFFVGKANDVITYLLQLFFPQLIIVLLARLRMVSSIYFYNKTAMSGYKVNNVVTYDMLTHKLFP